MQIAFDVPTAEMFWPKDASRGKENFTAEPTFSGMQYFFWKITFIYFNIYKIMKFLKILIRHWIGFKQPSRL